MSIDNNLTIKEWLDTEDQSCVDIVEKKYIQTINGNKETVAEMIQRVAGDNKPMAKFILERYILPAGRIISGRGMWEWGVKCTYSNCYVDPAPLDSIESIYNTCARIARTFSYGGGIGIDISNLAPSGAKVNNSAKQSTGAVSFIETFSNVASTIGQNNRRGALMLSIVDTHPDLPKFITHKRDLNLTQGANMSVRMSDKFFDAVEKDEDWKLSFTRKETGETISKTYKAKDILNIIAETNWDYAEPGVLYWDNICKNNLMSNSPSFQYSGTNPCAEEPLPGNGACLLASINLANFVIDNDHKKDFCFSQFKGVVKTGIRYLNEIQDENITLHPLPEQRECAKKWRLIGLGFMGLADMFIRMHIRYGSDESLSLIHKIGYTMIFEAFKESVNLAAEFGAFDGCNVDEIESTKFFKKNIEQNPMYSKRDREKLIKNFEEYGLRNAQLLTCAPTGTISTILSISGGIEPLFAISYNRLTKSIYGEDKSYTVHPKCIDELLREGYPMDEIEKLDFVVTARDISWKDRIEVQKAWQEHIDASISSTINLPESATVEEVAEIYKYAHKAGLKGTTIFRENCKRFPILTDNKKKKEDAKVTTEENIAEHKDEKMISKILTRKDLGVVLPGNTYYQKIACGHLYVTVNRYKGKPIEVFMNSSKSGGCSANTEAVGRMASTLLRSNVAPEIVIDTTYGIKCAACSNAKGKGESIDGLSCSDVMARIIKLEWQKYKNGDYDSEKDMEVTPITVAKKNDTPKVVNTNKRADYKNYTADENIAAGYCPECGSRLQMSEGCMICIACGFSKC